MDKGCETKVAEYYATGRHRITNVIPNDDFTLTISFDKGEVRLYDVTPLLEAGTVFAPFRDLKIFRRVYLDDHNCISWDIDPTIDSNVVWNNKVDLCSDACYMDGKPLTEGDANA